MAWAYWFIGNGSEFSGKFAGPMGSSYQTRIDFRRLGKPIDNCYIETFNRLFLGGMSEALVVRVAERRQRDYRRLAEELQRELATLGSQ